MGVARGTVWSGVAVSCALKVNGILIGKETSFYLLTSWELARLPGHSQV